MSSPPAGFPQPSGKGTPIGKYNMPFIVSAAAIGTVIDWYDFYIFGSLQVILSRQLFDPKMDPGLATVLTFLIFSTGFAVRPFGAIIFGRIGDLVGRKYAFLVTLLTMGIATAAIGFIPTYAQIGAIAAIIVALLRVVQGLALGGEYGGAAIYVAEHAPDSKRGFYTSFIQTTATIGVWASLNFHEFVFNPQPLGFTRVTGHCPVHTPPPL